MGWDELDDKLKRYIDKRFVSCDEGYELAKVKQAVKEEMPEFSDEEVDEAINACCESVKAPRPRDEFISCVKRQLRRIQMRKLGT